MPRVTVLGRRVPFVGAVAVLVALSVAIAGPPASATPDQDPAPSVPKPAPTATTAPSSTAPPSTAPSPPDTGADPTAPDSDPGASPGPSAPTSVPGSTGVDPADVPVLDLASIEVLLADQQNAAAAIALQAAALANGLAEQRVNDAAASVAALEATYAPAVAAVESAQAALSAAIAEVARVRALRTAVVLDTYQMTGTASDPRSGGLDDLLRGNQGFADHSNGTQYADAAFESVQAELKASEIARGAREDDVTAAKAALAELDTQLAGARKVLADAQAFASATREAGEAQVAAARRSVVADLSGAGGPTILGLPVINAADLAAFAISRGSPHPFVDMGALAVHFIEEGRAEGVRGDLAFAQSIIETGYFSFAGSMVEVGDHNYAGIGACDSCSRGHIYESPQLGVRAQMQLLRTYATPGLRTEDLANPPVLRRPEASSVRGCCDTWMKLSGVWATGPGYGIKILRLYNDMLRFAAARAAAGPGSPAAPPVAAAPPG